MIIAIDPGSSQSGYVVYDGKNITEAGKIDNWKLLDAIYWTIKAGLTVKILIEQVVSRGQPTSKFVLETVEYVGRLKQVGYLHSYSNCYTLTRQQVLSHLITKKAPFIKAGNVFQYKSSDAKVIEVLKWMGWDKKVVEGVKLKADAWQALALLVVWLDKFEEENENKS